MIAVNPYKNVIGPDDVIQYTQDAAAVSPNVHSRICSHHVSHGQMTRCAFGCQNLPPHVYALANNAYTRMSENKKDQSVVIR